MSLSLQQTGGGRRQPGAGIGDRGDVREPQHAFRLRPAIAPTDQHVHQFVVDAGCRRLARLRPQPTTLAPALAAEPVEDDPWVIPPEWTADTGPSGEGDGSGGAGGTDRWS